MKAKTFSGGYSFKRFGGRPEDELLPVAIPQKVIIPLTQGFGSPLEPLVKQGDNLYAGQIIGRSDNTVSSPAHASINGRVTDIRRMNYFKREVTMVIIEGDGSADYKRLEGHSNQWEKLPVEAIEKLLHESGVTSLDREGIPTRFKSSIITPEETEDLIIHGAESEAYNTSLDILLAGKNLFGFIEGLRILKKIMPNTRVHLALSQKRRKIIERIKKLTHNLDRFEIIPVAAKYPQGYDEVLIPTLLNKKFPYGYSAANIGIVVLNIQAVICAFEAVAEGKPLLERVIALAGPSFNRPLHVKVRVGTPLEVVLKGRLKEGPSRIVLNSLLTGFELNDLSLPIDRTFSQLVAVPDEKERRPFIFLRPGLRTDSYSHTFLSAFTGTQNLPDTNLHGEERPCIQCGYCISVCPVSIMPTLLDRIAKKGAKESLLKYEIFNCIDCGLCSYVCPSKIPLAATLKEAKGKLTEIGCDHSLCILPKFNLKGLADYKGIKVTR